MTPEESQMLNDLADKIAKTPSPAHDAEAEQFIRTRIGSRPDALYIMTQTVLIQNMAIEHARQQIQELQQRAAQGPEAAPAGGSFTGVGRQPGYAAAPPPPPLPNYAQAPPAYNPPPPSGMSSFLHSAATTAAGVAAGALAFEGIRSLFGGLGNFGGGFGGGGFGGGGMHSSFLGGAPETIVNNYYDSPEPGGGAAAGLDDADPSDSSAQDLSGQDDDNTAQDSDDSGDSDNSGGDAGYDGGDDSGGGDDGGGGGDWA